MLSDQFKNAFVIFFADQISLGIESRRRILKQHKIQDKTNINIMRKKSKARRQLIKEKISDDLELQRNSDIENDIAPTNKLQNDFLEDNHAPMTDDILTDTSNGTEMKGTKRKRKRSSNSATFKRIKKNDTVIKETPSSSLGSAAKTFYCSQNLYESVNECDPNIMHSIVPSVTKNVASYSQMKISQCSTTQTTNDSRTISGLDRTPVSNSLNLEQDGKLCYKICVLSKTITTSTSINYFRWINAKPGLHHVTIV